MQTQQNIIKAYNETATEYAAKFINELSKKHLDRILLKQFAEENKSKGGMIDLGCGPGQTTKFLFGCGVKNITGTDISPGMVAKAQQLNPQIKFEVTDMLQLQYRDKTFASAVAFYAIVHFNYEQVKIALKEISRVLIDKGQFLFSFHIGEEVVHVDNFLGKNVTLDFHFFKTEKILELLHECGFTIIDVIERQPYKDVEYPSKRAYIWVEKE